MRLLLESRCVREPKVVFVRLHGVRARAEWRVLAGVLFKLLLSLASVFDHRFIDVTVAAERRRCSSQTMMRNKEIASASHENDRFERIATSNARGGMCDRNAAINVPCVKATDLGAASQRDLAETCCVYRRIRRQCRPIVDLESR